MISSADVTAALRRFGVVEWWRISIGLDPRDGLHRPPLIVWRYSSPGDQVRELIHRTVSGLPTSVDWDVDTSGKNWTIIPEILRREYARHAGDSYTGVLGDVKRSDQLFCEKANLDMVLFVRELNDTAAF
ncbi:hypothetical protein GT755_27195 [Herbidospora sp. NEAU-GS84]|uniref:Uncharacterized protein n=1 Tax=Herbidospora solisilvae TaxID=2696284 RepID=A0A7C9NKD0_9ACTN|nr:hypothetical protein [Herbidospora solisilvae]NAS25358.1 hypothetical protein [Herbidospora solisilvae]